METGEHTKGCRTPIYAKLAADRQSRCGIAGCTGNHEPQHHNAAMEPDENECRHGTPEGFSCRECAVEDSYAQAISDVAVWMRKLYDTRIGIADDGYRYIDGRVIGCSDFADALESGTWKDDIDD